MKPEELPRITASHLVKSIDLNHHGTLFAGRMAEWLVEVGFITARAALACEPGALVCVRLHGMDFRESINKGETLVLEGRVAHVGRSSITIYVEAYALRPATPRSSSTDGFVTLVHVSGGQATPHGLTVTLPEEPQAREIWDHVVEERQHQRRKSG